MAGEDDLVTWFEENYDMTREQAEQAADVERAGFGDADPVPLGTDGVSQVSRDTTGDDDLDDATDGDLKTATSGDG